MEMIVVGMGEEDVAHVFEPYTKWSQSLGRFSRRKTGMRIILGLGSSWSTTKVQFPPDPLPCTLNDSDIHAS